MARVVLAGYLVRNPLGGYVWQAGHYLLGLRALGHDAWFYEDTGHFALAYNPLTNEYGPRYEHGLAATADFLRRIGFADRWVFVDVEGGVEHGPGTGRAADLLRDADLLIDVAGRDVTFRGETFAWRKRTEWLRCLELPERTGRGFEVAMDVDSVPGDRATLAAHGWEIVDPLAVSADPWRYRDYLRGSRGEFTVAKDMNVRLRSGWFSDRAACYLAAGRPVVEQDTGFGDVLPLGPGVHAFRVVDEAAAAVAAIEADYARASAHAAAVARELFAADRVLAQPLGVVGL